MRSRVARTLAAGIFVLGAAALVIGPALAQAEDGKPDPATPDAQTRRGAGPSLPGPEQQAPERDSQADPNEPGLQHGCPDQGRPLQLIV